MADGGRGARLAQESIPHLRFRARQNGFDRSRPLEAFVDRVVDNAHPATPDLPHDSVVTDAPEHVDG
jgi:hypothetical protein